MVVVNKPGRGVGRGHSTSQQGPALYEVASTLFQGGGKTDTRGFIFSRPPRRDVLRAFVGRLDDHAWKLARNRQRWKLRWRPEQLPARPADAPIREYHRFDGLGRAWRFTKPSRIPQRCGSKVTKGQSMGFGDGECREPENSPVRLVAAEKLDT